MSYLVAYLIAAVIAGTLFVWNYTRTHDTFTVDVALFAFMVSLVWPIALLAYLTPPLDTVIWRRKS